MFTRVIPLFLVGIFYCGNITVALQENNLLVVYNSQSADSQEVHDYYKTVRPNVLSLDLNDASALAPTISYADFALRIRDPIRAHLNTNNLEEQIHVIVLTKDIPHRIQSLDLQNANIGDSGGGIVPPYNNGNATFASVDSELTLLQLDLETGENGGSMDSAADRAVINPFFDSSARFNTFSRSEIASNNLSFTQQNVPGYGTWWRLQERQNRIISMPSSPGNIYLTARLDASTVADVKAMIDRAQRIQFRKQFDAIVLDADTRSDRLDDYTDPLTNLTRSDYPEATAAVSGDWARVFSDETNSFLTGLANPISFPDVSEVNGPIAYLHSYGVNHNGNNAQLRDYLATYALQLPPGATFSAYESYGAAGLGGLSNRGQAQVEEWLSAGGTFATGPVWEPFVFGIARSEVFLNRFMNDGFTFVEAAWASILQLSWQTVVIGDPLATASFVGPSHYETWSFGETGNVPYADPALGFGEDFDLDGLFNGYEFILGLAPDQSDSGSDRQLEYQLIQGIPTLFLTLEVDNADATTIRVQSSETLLPDGWSEIALRDTNNEWTGLASVQETLSGILLDIEIQVPAPIKDKRFFRLLVTEE